MWGVQGFPGLWKGMSATVYREVPGYMGQFVVYEYIKQYVPSHTHITAHATAHAHDRTRTQLIN
jgi:predicted MFS family arabinose efflux permease